MSRDAAQGGKGRVVFDFGLNWRDYSRNRLDAGRLDEAAASLDALVGTNVLRGCDFLDVGSGSGLFSLAALQLGAARCRGVDVSQASVETALENHARLGERLGAHEPPEFLHGSILDDAVVASLDPADVVYAWGSLHHTGAMWHAIDNTASLVRRGGVLVLAIYNRHWTSPVWTLIKRLYNALPGFGRKAMALAFAGIIFAGAWITTGRSPLKAERGMDFWYDVVDWLGGYPYEYASRDEVVRFMATRGFEAVKVVPQRGWTGCVEYVFRKEG